MSTDARLAELVNGFVMSITRLAREAAVETLSAALASSDGRKSAAVNSAGRSSPPPPATTSTGSSRSSAMSPAATTPSTQQRRKGAKRPAAEVERLKALLSKHIERNPGQRVEEINAALGTTTRDVARPLGKLIAAGKVKSRGARRATQYFPG
jgi:hypothetical protein